MEELRKQEAESIRKELEEIDNGLKDPESVTSKIIMEKQDIPLYYAKKYERLYELGLSDIPVNKIANFLRKHFEELNANIATSTIYDNLPARFKTHKPNPNTDTTSNTDHSDNRNGNSSLNTQTFEQENNSWIKICDLQIDFWRSFKNKMQTSHFLSLLKAEERRERMETLGYVYQIIKIANAFCDDRQSVPVTHQHMLVESFATQTNNDASGFYITKIKDFGANRSKESTKNLKSMADASAEILKHSDNLTPKQGVKILLGHVTEVAAIYEPMNRNEALLCGYHGTQCPNIECRSWRTYLDFDANELECRCWACDKGFPRGVASKCKNCYIPFYDEDLIAMKKNATQLTDGIIETQCPNPKCKVPVYLPIQKMMTILVKAK